MYICICISFYCRATIFLFYCAVFFLPKTNPWHFLEIYVWTYTAINIALKSARSAQTNNRKLFCNSHAFPTNFVGHGNRVPNNSDNSNPNSSSSSSSRDCHKMNDMQICCCACSTLKVRQTSQLCQAAAAEATAAAELNKEAPARWHSSPMSATIGCFVFHLFRWPWRLTPRSIMIFSPLPLPQPLPATQPNWCSDCQSQSF